MKDGDSYRGREPTRDDTSRMTGDCHVRFREGLGVQFPGPTRRTRCCDGYESGRGCLRKKCPAKAYGFKCASAGICPASGVIRIPLETNWRIFNAVDRSSLKWKREYAHRSSVERVYSRMDVSLGFELHSLRGQRRIRLQCPMGLITMLGVALGRIRQKKPELMRGLVRSA